MQWPLSEPPTPERTTISVTLVEFQEHKEQILTNLPPPYPVPQSGGSNLVRCPHLSLNI